MLHATGDMPVCGVYMAPSNKSYDYVICDMDESGTVEKEIWKLVSEVSP